MPLNVTPVNRNLQTRVTFMLLEFEDLFVVLGIAAVTNVVGHFVSGDIGGLPMSIVVQQSRMRSGAPFITSRCCSWLLVAVSWMDNCNRCMRRCPGFTFNFYSSTFSVDFSRGFKVELF